MPVTSWFSKLLGVCMMILILFVLGTNISSVKQLARILLYWGTSVNFSKVTFMYRLRIPVLYSSELDSLWEKKKVIM